MKKVPDIYTKWIEDNLFTDKLCLARGSNLEILYLMGGRCSRIRVSWSKNTDQKAKCPDRGDGKGRTVCLDYFLPTQSPPGIQQLQVNFLLWSLWTLWLLTIVNRHWPEIHWKWMTVWQKTFNLTDRLCIEWRFQLLRILLWSREKALVRQRVSPFDLREPAHSFLIPFIQGWPRKIHVQCQWGDGNTHADD